VNLSGQSRVSALSIYEHLGFSEIARRTEDGYRRIYMEKMLPDFG